MGDLIKPEDDKPSVFKPLIHIEKDDVVVSNSCRLCNHELRFATESYWLSNKQNIAKTLTWLNEQIDTKNADKLTDDEKDDKFTYQSLRNHLVKHYADQERQIRLKEYAKNVESLMRDKQSHDNMLEMSLAVCKENLARVATAETFGDPALELKRSDAINKVISQMISVMNEQAKLRGEIDAFDIVQEQFTNLWIDIINKEQNDAKKKVLAKMLEEFAGEIENGDFSNG